MNLSEVFHAALESGLAKPLVLDNQDLLLKLAKHPYVADYHRQQLVRELVKEIQEYIERCEDYSKSDYNAGRRTGALVCLDLVVIKST